jgi:ribonuclease HII
VFGLNDSKLLTHEQREELFEELHSGSNVIGVGIISHDEIDRIGLQPANYLAMARAIEALHLQPDYLLVDGFKLPGVAQPVLRIIKGDQRSLSIAAASIVAKVTRDRIMIELALHYPQYGFDRHKGYHTPEHLEALDRHGPCAIHRRSFAPIAQIPETAYML